MVWARMLDSCATEHNFHSLDHSLCCQIPEMEIMHLLIRGHLDSFEDGIADQASMIRITLCAHSATLQKPVSCSC